MRARAVKGNNFEELASIPDFSECYSENFSRINKSDKLFLATTPVFCMFVAKNKTFSSGERRGDRRGHRRRL